MKKSELRIKRLGERESGKEKLDYCKNCVRLVKHDYFDSCIF